MSRSAKSKLIRQNTLCWLGAILLPVILHFGLAGTRFPWPVVLAMLLFPLMLASNRFVSRAAEDGGNR
jgi:hypothetical protein